MALARNVLRFNDSSMTPRSVIARVTQQKDLNFLLTNRLPRRWLTLFAGWLSQVEQPLVRASCLAIWRLFSDLDLSDARTTQFRSLHECFTRQLKDGARRIDTDPQILVSPCDAIVGDSFQHCVLTCIRKEKLMKRYYAALALGLSTLVLPRAR